MRRRLVLALVPFLLCGLLGVPATAQTPRPEYTVVDPSFQALPGATGYSGTQSVGGADSGWQIEVPDDWNGTLVLYAHGFVGAAQPELVVQPPPLRELFIGSGVAWAASSYSSNGYVIDAAVEETQQLLLDFAARTGEAAPGRVIIHGFSMGGHITGVATERYGSTYDGALPVCGVMGDIELFDYFTGANAIAGALAGVDVPIPADLGFAAGPSQQIAARLGLDETVTTVPAGRQYAEALEQLSGGERPLFDEAFDYWNRTAAIDLGEGGRLPFLQAVYAGVLSEGIEDPVGADAAVDTSDVVYGYDAEVDLAETPRPPSPEEVALNAAVARTAESAAPPFPVITGAIDIPVLTLHTLGDLFVPFAMQEAYRERVTSQGRSDLLVQRAIRDLGHCGFTGEELATAFLDLNAWIDRDGAQPPAGDDLDRVAVRDRFFGCAFSAQDRAGLPPCDGPQQVRRASDTDRVGTAIALAADTYETATTVVLARADGYADALAGAPLATRLRAPVLLTGPDALDPRVATEIDRLGASEVVLLGGTVALSDAVLADAQAAAGSARRVAGANRFATAANVAAEVAPDGAADVFLAKGLDADPNGGFPDAVALSGLAAFLGRPLLLVSDVGLPGETAAALDALGAERAELAGGAAAVSTGVEGAVEQAGVTVERLAGPTRYDTSARIAERSTVAGTSFNRLVVATGAAFPDALVAGPAAAARGGTLLLVDGRDLSGSQDSTSALIREEAALVDDLVIAGGQDAVSADAEAGLVFALRPPD